MVKTKQPICYKTMKRNGKWYSLFKKDDIEQAIQFTCEFQCYTNRYYNISTKPYHGKYFDNNEFIWLVEG